MTRIEIIGNRDLTFSGWIRKNLPEQELKTFLSCI